MNEPDGAPAGGSVPRLLLTPEEAAQALGIGRSTIFKLFASGKLASVQIGTSRRISLAQLERFVAELAGDAGKRRRPNTRSVQSSPGAAGSPSSARTSSALPLSAIRPRSATGRACHAGDTSRPRRPDREGTG